MSQRQIGQTMRFNDAELEVIKSLFAEDDDNLYLIRKVLLQFDMTATEKKKLKGLMTPINYAVVKKTFLPDLDGDSPFFQLSDMRVSLKVELNGKSVDDAWPIIQAKKVAIDYMTQQFEVLKDLDAEIDTPIKLKDLANISGDDKELTFVDITAWQYLLSYVDSGLQNMLKNLAGQKGETTEQTKKRLKQDSAK